MRVHKVLLAVLFATVTIYVPAQDGSSIIKNIQQAIRKADAPALASFFSSTIDLEVGDTDGNYSKNQAEMILRDFFQSNPVKAFTARHQGASNDGSQYLIGAYTSSNNQEFRVYVLIKGKEPDMLIHQLQFEKD